MNVYILDMNHEDNVKQYPNVILLNCAQYYKKILSTAITNNGGVGICSPLKKDPWVDWVGRNSGNWLWFYNLNVALCKEMAYREFDTTNEALTAILQLDPTRLRQGSITKFPDTLPKDCCISKIFEMNNKFTIYTYATNRKYTKRDVPVWMSRDYWIDYFERRDNGIVPGK